MIKRKSQQTLQMCAIRKESRLGCNRTFFRFSGLSLAMAALMASGVALSQEDPEQAEEVIEEVVVVGIKGALQSALDTKRDSDVIMDGISANDIGNFPDLNLAESLQRVTGVQISVEGDEGQRRQGRIAIRGLPTNYSVTTYNGQFLGTPRPDFGFSFGNIESSVVSAVNVLKTTTARMDAGGLAGTVDIQSKRALDVQEPYVRLGLQTTYETNLEDYAPGYSLAFGTKFADDKWGVVGSISTAEQHFRTDVVRINSYNSDDTDGDGLDDFYVPSQVRLISRDSEGDRLSATLGLEFQATDKLKLGVDALYVEDPIVHNFAMMRAYKAEEYVPLDSVTNSTFGETVTRVNFLNPEIRSQQRIIDEENKTEALTFNAEWTNDDWTVKGAIHHTKGTQLAIGSISRRRLDDDPGNGINILVDTGAGNVNNFEFQEFTGALSDPNTYSYTAACAGDADPSRCVSRDRGVGQWFITTASGHEYDTSDEETAYKLDVIRHFNNSVITTVEAGIKLRDTEQLFVRPEWELPSSEFDYSQVSDLGALVSFSEFTSGNGEDFFGGGLLGNQIDNFYFQNDPLTAQTIAATGTISGPTFGGLPVPADGGGIAEQTAHSERDIFAAYVMTTFDLSNLDSGLPVRGNFGLRYVDTDRKAFGFYDPDGVAEPIEASTSFDHLLPSFNLMWDVREDLVLRGSYSETFVRPHTWNFRVHTFVDVVESGGVTDSISWEVGNAELQPFEAESIDLSAEWYSANGSAVSLAYFQKEVSNGFDNRDLCPASIDDIAQISGTSQASLLTGSLSRNASGICVDEAGVEVSITDIVNNSDSFDLKGYEIGVFLPFDFMDVPVVRNMGIQANYTYVDTSEGPDKDASGNTLPLAGVSEDTYNLIAFWEGEQVAVRFAYTSRSDYFEETVFTSSGDARFIDTEDRLDMQISYSPKQLENLNLSFEAFNLTDEQYYAYQGTEQRAREWREAGKTFSFKIQYEF